MNNKVDLIFQSNLPARAVNVYLYLSYRANTQGVCWPSKRLIAKDLHISVSTVERAVNDLRESGCILTTQRMRDSGAKSSLMYQLLK